MVSDWRWRTSWPIAAAWMCVLLWAVSAVAAPPPRGKSGKSGKSGRGVVLRTVQVADGIVGLQSPHFWIVTDMPADEAGPLLVRLETMLELVAGYWLPDPRVRMVKLQKMTIPCMVIRDVYRWPRELVAGLDAGGLRSATGGGGLTVSQSLYLKDVAVEASAVVYASAEHNTTLHETVHAFSQLVFATTGPTWYSEGMAENGKYWREGQMSVGADPRVIQYLRETTPRKSVAEVLAPFQATGDSWQNYAWRWALCHMLMTNPNYSADFRRLGMLFLDKGRVKVETAAREGFWLRDFQEIFGDRAAQIEFEYGFFLDHLESGLRADLCAWDWKKRPTPLTAPARIIAAKIAARGGWQPMGVAVVEGQSYDYAAAGSWRIAPDGPLLSADGRPIESEEAAEPRPAADKPAQSKPAESVDGGEKSSHGKGKASPRGGKASERSQAGERSQGEKRRPPETDAGRLEAVLLQGSTLSKPFLLGARGTFTAPGSGGLYVRCRNHWPELANHSGGMTVRLRLHHEQPPEDRPAEKAEEKPAEKPEAKDP